ncbi:MAG: UDP-2,3-diacylglucosamine diphosphatase [Pseudomonadota bacterium]|nr:UDP-2,3-diacylglucosamine diphosphatase [Pseudomonadota bacterium]
MTGTPAIGVLHAPAHWRVVDFISDLHLHAGEPDTFAAWARYIRHTPADAVFILGDLFEVWVGDDAALPGSFEDSCAQVLTAAATRTQVYFMHGNRDFLVGSAFLSRCGVQPLADPTALHGMGQVWLLTHGDLLCTEDVAYQQFRRQVRAPQWQAAMLARPLAERQAIGRQMRAQSQAQQGEHAPGYDRIDTPLARQWLSAAGAHALIHGHTHAPGDHDLGRNAQGQALTQHVLSDWHVTPGQQRMQVLRLSTAGLARVPPEAG